MLHQPSGAARGKASDIQNEAQELIRTKQYLYNVLAEKTGKSYETVRLVTESNLHIGLSTAVLF